MGSAEVGIALRFGLVGASMVNSVPIWLAVGWAKSPIAAIVIPNHGRRFCPRRHTERLDRVGNAPAHHRTQCNCHGAGALPTYALLVDAHQGRLANRGV